MKKAPCIIVLRCCLMMGLAAMTGAAESRHRPHDAAA